jgi:hypothetical protein
MVFTSHNWFAMQGSVAIILISWNVIFIWKTGFWTRAIKIFALFDLLKSLYSDTKILSKYIPITVFKYRNKIGKIVVKKVPYSVNVNVKNTFTSHIDRKIFLTFFFTSLSLCIFTIWKCIAYNRFCRDGIYFDKILVSEYKLFKRSNKANILIAWHPWK